MQAFLAASLKTDAELLKWFRDRLIWNEPETVVDLLKNGLFVRLYEPQVGIHLFRPIPAPKSICCCYITTQSFLLVPVSLAQPSCTAKSHYQICLRST